MRPITLVGLIVIAFGAVTLILGGNFTASRDVLQAGYVFAHTQPNQPLTPWLAAAALIVGTVFVVSGLGNRAYHAHR